MSLPGVYIASWIDVAQASMAALMIITSDYPIDRHSHVINLMSDIPCNWDFENKLLVLYHKKGCNEENQTSLVYTKQACNTAFWNTGKYKA